MLFPEEGENCGGPELALKVKNPCTSMPRTSSSLLETIVLSTVQEAEITSIVIPAKGATHGLLREIRLTEQKCLRDDSKQCSSFKTETGLSSCSQLEHVLLEAVISPLPFHLFLPSTQSQSIPLVAVPPCILWIH